MATCRLADAISSTVKAIANTGIFSPSGAASPSPAFTAIPALLAPIVTAPEPTAEALMGTMTRKVQLLNYTLSILLNHPS